MQSSPNKHLIIQSEQKQLMLTMLKFIDDVCRKNNIKYSLIGGSLIGAIRHKGYIPWDDDIDIILTKRNYDKLKTILDKENGRYQTLKYNNGGEKFNFIKLIDTRTHAKEDIQLTYDPNYGIYIDIFYYQSIPNELSKQKHHYKKMKFYHKLIMRTKVDFKTESLHTNLRRIIKNTISALLGYSYINKKVNALSLKNSNTSYVMSCWPVYKMSQEIQLAKNTEEYIDAKFENLTVMIFKNYDEILRTTFGDYMQLPPKSERIPKHSLTAWWREENE